MPTANHPPVSRASAAMGAEVAARTPATALSTHAAGNTCARAVHTSHMVSPQAGPTKQGLALTRRPALQPQPCSLCLLQAPTRAGTICHPHPHKQCGIV